MNMSKKASLIHVYNILNKYSDETHRLTRKQIEQYLLLEYDCELNRKTLHDHIQTLNDCGCDIHFATSAKDGYFIAQRLFEPYEIHLLCNAIYASHFIPEKASNDLIQKLFSTQSQYMKKDFNKTVYMRNMRKTQNKEFFLNIELLTEAIQESSGKEMTELKASLETIQATAKELITEIEGHFTELQQGRAGKTRQRRETRWRECVITPGECGIAG